MKGLIALPVAVLMGVSFQASALCLSVSESYSGIIESRTELIVHGPFAITPANGCSGASIDAVVSPGGAGSAPRISIERELGGGWQSVATSIGNSVSHVGNFGTYRVRLDNPEAIPKSYSGNVRYGR
ncbi:hypothetical protein [Pseudomonas sp. DWP1b1]|uniref:hypothetical protein n=1 Tax=unclassified Pseudomonas TaxID=196821 RepID=UPI003CF3B213